MKEDAHHIKAVIFDLDGVIIDSNPVIEIFWRGWGEKYGVVMDQQVMSQWIYGRTGEDTIAGLFPDVPENVKEEIRAGGEALGVHMVPNAMEGVAYFIRALADKNIPIGLVTSSGEMRMQKMITQVGITDCFTAFITAKDVSRGKPDPEPYAKMSAKLGIDPLHCLVFEDAWSGIQSAVAAGMVAVGIGNHLFKDSLLQHGATEVIENFTQIKVSSEGLHVAERMFTF